MRVVVALGGNAMLRRGEPMTAANQRANIRRAAVPLAGLVRAGHMLIITHGNGPQIGLLAEAETGWPLDVLGAETEGMIGFVIEQELENALDHAHPVATMLTQVLVDPDDPAFRAPTKFVGPMWTHAEAKAMAAPRDWTIAQDGKGWRRVVPSPMPMGIPDIRALRLLVDNGVIVICGGGGGIPIARAANGTYHGVEAVIDKDHLSALLAKTLAADALLLLTDVDAVYQNFGTPDATAITTMTPTQAAALPLPAGSMRPKVLACCNFVTATGGIAAIGKLADAADILAGRAGTRIVAQAE